ncbi:flagellin [Thioclava sp. GXIMD4216]|uniref:Flagellin n=1 Tax=Thioclava litoralis TaxID=3076557 RepID=A0ABZ1DXZ8_9RHOB|nr:flagellin [Thioclava sp. FTW29]
MSYYSVGDMAQVYSLRKHNTGLKNLVTTLSQEATTGLKSDVGKAVGGDFTQLSAITRSLDNLESYSLATTEVSLTAEMMQNALGTIQDYAINFGPDMISIGSSGDPTSLETLSTKAKTSLSTIVSALNSSVAGRFVFSGAATNTPPVVDADEMYSQVMTAVGGDTTSAGIIAAVEAFFDAPAGGGGYLDQSYQGSRDPLGAVKVSENESIQLEVTAQSSEIRESLKGAMLARIAANDDGTLSDETRSALMVEAGSVLSAASLEMSASRSSIGAAEEQIESAATRNDAESSSLEIARNNLITAEPYETSTALIAAQNQLETLYEITSRLSQLTLADYI